MRRVRIAVIGGTGLYRVDGTAIIDSIDIDTPFGKPSDSIKVLQYGSREVAFLPRHGVGHRYLPSEIPVKANIWALKRMGVEHIISISAVGSLKEKIKPRDIVIPNQIIDRTRSRTNSFFGDGIVGHVSFADPVCPHLKANLYETAVSIGNDVHNDETYICMEGPLFSTRAESNLYRSWGGGVIGMTALPEAKLAREAEICYAIVALTTDYDCWKENEDDVTIDIVVENLKACTHTAQLIIKKAVERIPEKRKCTCGTSAQYAIITAKQLIPEAIKKKLDIFYGKYWR